MNSICIAAASDGLPDPITDIVIWFCVLAFITLIHFILCFIGADVEAELTELHARRMQRVRAALQSTVDHDWNAPNASPAYPFEGWIHLTDQGVVVAGQSFNPQETAFEVSAKDQRNIPRAMVRLANPSRGLSAMTSRLLKFC